MPPRQHWPSRLLRPTFPFGRLRLEGIALITLHHLEKSQSIRILWLLEELGVPYELKLLPFPPRALSPSYLEINPLGTIPFFVDGQAQMTESAAIVQYLAVKHGGPLAVAPDDPAYGDWLNWLHRNYSVRSLTMDELRRELGPTAPVLTGSGDWTYSAASP